MVSGQDLKVPNSYLEYQNLSFKRTIFHKRKQVKLMLSTIIRQQHNIIWCHFKGQNPFYKQKLKLFNYLIPYGSYMYLIKAIHQPKLYFWSNPHISYQGYKSMFPQCIFLIFSHYVSYGMVICLLKYGEWTLTISY